jgi:glycosyltransferase involved in cell wall biosynthesis
MALAVCLPSAVLFVEVFAATVVSRGRPEREGERPRVAILMPAHNEESMLGGTLRTIMPQLQPSDRLLVVADNCTDGTPGVARALGAEVLIRADLTHVGKGYALDFGVRHLASDPPDIVIVIDADCQVAAGSIDMLARRCKATLRPVQSLLRGARARPSESRSSPG